MLHTWLCAAGIFFSLVAVTNAIVVYVIMNTGEEQTKTLELGIAMRFCI